MRNRARTRQKTLRLFQRTIKKCLAPKERLTVSEWAARHRVLDESSNLSGRWSNDVTPYLVEIMDTLVDPSIREVYLCKASQLGGTEAVANMIMYIIDEDPAPTMIVYPSDDLAKDISNDKLKPAFNLSPNIRKKFLPNSSKELRLKFKDMVIYLRGSNSPSKLASKAIKYLFFDEIDKMGGASKKEASPYNLAKERLKTYKSQSKLFACSTPTLKINYIWTLHEEADEVRHYFVPCPHCGEMIELNFGQIEYEKDENKEMSIYERAQTARYICPMCGSVITDAQKPAMLRAGKWIAVKRRGIGKPKTVGFWINSLYSIFITWADVAEEFMKTKDNPEELQNFVNSWLAEPWEDTKLRTSKDLVLDRQTELPELIVPAWAKMLTGGVDIQETSMYYTIRAWGDFVTSQNIRHGQVLGFADIEHVMNQEYIREDGERMIVELALVDSGFESDSTYDFCMMNQAWAVAVKGANNPMQGYFKIGKVNKSGKYDGIPLVMVDGDKYKSMIAGRMMRENGRGSWMVHSDCDEDYACQVTSEQKVIERVNGKLKEHWVPKKNKIDNHYLDAEVYAMAAADIRGVRSLYLQNVQEEKKPTPRRKSEEEQWIGENEMNFPQSDWI